VIFKIPEDINIKIPKATIIVGSGPDWNKLTQFASDIKATKKVEPYKGKGIFLKGEWILRKDGKKAKN
jgi:large subunit ribosomal protein L6